MASLNFYSSLARSYDSLYAEEQKRKIDLIKQSGIEIKGKLLDVGCGTGISTNAWKCAPFKVGVDACIEMLKIAKEKFPNGFFVCAKAEHLPFKNGVFDSVICLTAFHNFNDVQKSLTEMKRVSNEKCTFVISVLKKSRRFNELVNSIKKLFSSCKEIIDKHDLILIRKF